MMWRNNKERILLILLFFLLLLNFIQLTPSLKQIIIIIQEPTKSSYYYYYYGTTTTTTINDTTSTTNNNTTTIINESSSTSSSFSLLYDDITTAVVVSDDEDDDDDVDNKSPVATNFSASTASTSTTHTRILNISTYDDLLEVLDLVNPHYCGYFKCYYSTTTINSSNSNNIGLFVSQEGDSDGENNENINWVTNDWKINKTQSYYDIMYQSYLFSKKVTTEFPRIRSLLAGPPIKLIDTPTVEQLNKLNHVEEQQNNNTKFIKYIQQGSYNWGQPLYTTQKNSSSSSYLIIQEVYELQQYKNNVFEIRLELGQRRLRYFISKRIIETYDNTNVTFLLSKLKSFMNTFTNDIYETQLLLKQYPIMGEDFQIFVDTNGNIYQTDWDRIYFIYDWSKWNYDTTTKTNNHTKIVYEYILPYLDKLIDECNDIYVEVVKNNNTQSVTMKQIERRRKKLENLQRKRKIN